MRTPSEASNTKSGSFFRFVIYSCFFLSGAAGLVYEVVWARQLGLFLGITSFAHTAVITAYMAGLAAGSLYFGRRADSGIHPLKVYAWLEVGVGLYAASTPWLFDLLQSLYASVAGVAGVTSMGGHLARFSIALAALLVPTFLMGGTLPLLVRGFIHDLPELGQTTGRLYGLNTVGAMSGTLIAGYYLLPVHGITLAIFTGVAINIGVALLVFGMLRLSSQTGLPTDAPEPRPVDTKNRSTESRSLAVGSRAVVLIAFGTAGFAALLTQLAWIKALIMVVGGSVYAFTITLATFLAGIGLGSLLYARFLPDRSWSGEAVNNKRMQRAAALAALIAFSILLGLPLIGRLPGWFLAGYAAGLHVNFGVFQAFIFFLSFALMILPTLFMGALMPLVTTLWTSSHRQVGRGVGGAYAINTTGTILGALLGGLLILPWLGIQRSIQMAASLYLLAALLFWWKGTEGTKPLVQVLSAALLIQAFLLAAWQVPPWDKALMASGAYYRPESTVEALAEKSLGEIVRESRLLFYKEGHHGTVSVTESDKQRTLSINGKADASSKGDLPTQVLLGQLPLLLHTDPRKVMIIGLGSGITAGAIATDLRVEAMTVLEISDEVIEASDYFRAENHDVLNDHRTNLVSADARNYLLASQASYDLIVSEPSNPWMSGAANLFTDEFFSLAKSRLNDQGLMTQWIHIYGMSNEDLRTILNTFNRHFEHVSVWRPQTGDLVLVGSDVEHQLDWTEVNALVNADDDASELQRLGMDEARDLVYSFIFANPELENYAHASRTNRDEHPVVEFNAPRYLYAETVETNLTDIFQFLNTRKVTVPITGMHEVTAASIDARAMNLEIAIPGEREAEAIQSTWVIGRFLLLENEQNVYGIGSHRNLSWREGPSTFHVQASWHEQAHEHQQLMALLGQLQESEIERGGEINLREGNNGSWLMSPSQTPGMTDFGLGWLCPSRTGGFTRYFVRAQVPAASDWGQDLVEIAGRFSCYP